MGCLIKGIIFSYDRAMQLDAALRSFFLHCSDQETIKMTVLYKISDEKNLKQYSRLAADYPQVDFVQQSNFRQDVLSWAASPTTRKKAKLYQIFTLLFNLSCNKRIINFFFNKYLRRLLVWILPYDKNENLLFLVDDNIFTHHFSIQKAIGHLINQPKALGFSLRLGRNTNYCYSLRQDQSIPNFLSKGDQILQYNWTTAECDFNYPLEISSSIYRKDQLLPLMLRINFDNPNRLEGEMAVHSTEYRRRFPYLLLFEESITFCNPLNLVQTVASNRAGKNHNYAVESLCKLFESGKRVNVNNFDQFVSTGCHQEVELPFFDIKDSN